MEGSRIPIVTAHGEGRAVFDKSSRREARIVALRYVDNRGKPTETYPYNPNGSPAGHHRRSPPPTAASPSSCRTPSACSARCRCPGRPDDAGEDSPWMRMFRNARAWVG